MYYRKALQEAGFDPANIKDATKADEFILHIGVKELKGSEIGNPMTCAGARACKQQQRAKFAWIGASTAILGFPDGRLIRYIHNGMLPKGHDQGMFAVGKYKFKRQRNHDMPEMRKAREQRRIRKPDDREDHDSKGLKKAVAFHPKPSIAAQMRRGWEVEMD